MMLASGWRMGRVTLTITLSLVGAGAVAFCIFVLLEDLLPRAGSVLFRFQLSSMLAMGVFAGLAIVLYVRLSRSRPGGELEGNRTGRDKRTLRK